MDLNLSENKVQYRDLVITKMILVGYLSNYQIVINNCAQWS